MWPLTAMIMNFSTLSTLNLSCLDEKLTLETSVFTVPTAEADPGNLERKLCRHTNRSVDNRLKLPSCIKYDFHAVLLYLHVVFTLCHYLQKSGLPRCTMMILEFSRVCLDDFLVIVI